MSSIKSTAWQKVKIISSLLWSSWNFKNIFNSNWWRLKNVEGFLKNSFLKAFSRLDSNSPNFYLHLNARSEDTNIKNLKFNEMPSKLLYAQIYKSTQVVSYQKDIFLFKPNSKPPQLLQVRTDDSWMILLNNVI